MGAAPPTSVVSADATDVMSAHTTHVVVLVVVLVVVVSPCPETPNNSWAAGSTFLAGAFFPQKNPVLGKKS